MQKYISVIAVALFCTLFTACELETSDNGDLDGFWHLVEVDTLATGGVKDLHQSKMFWAFQMNLLQFTGSGRYFARFSHENGQLIVNQPQSYDSKKGHQPITDVSVLAPLGLNDLEVQFSIEYLSGSSMILNDGTLRLQFTKM